MELYCKNCNYKLTDKILVEAKKEELNYNDDVNLLPKNKFTFYSVNDFGFEIKITYLININSIKLNSNYNKMNGCCGSSETTQYNQLCPNCKNEIGVLISDCWMPHFIGIDKDKTSLKPIW